MKRRKIKGNPYSISYSEENDTYSLSFIRNHKKEEIIISKMLYEEFNKFELDDKSYMNKYDRHIEHSELTENSLNARMSNEKLYTEDIVLQKIQNENLHIAISKLPKIQRNRLINYYFYDISKKDMSLNENCSIRAIQYSIDIALKNLKKFLI